MAPELVGYCYLTKMEVPNYVRKAAKLFRYHKTVFITPPWQEIYQHDTLRKQSWEEAVETYQCICKAYQEAGYQLIEVPKVSINERVGFILGHCDKRS